MFCALSVLSYHAVDNALTAEDRRYIPLYLQDVRPLAPDPTYEDELRFIVSVQRLVLGAAPGNVGLPFDQQREPKDLLAAKTGLCFDRSRAIEKILRYAGFKTRHIAIYATEKTNTAIKSIITPGIESHAVTEVLTQNGWLVVDSNAPWVSADSNDQPISIEAIKLNIENTIAIEWGKEPPTAIYTKPFTFVFGLYSRHGRFYPPYNFVPDINYGEFFQNLI